MSSGDTAVDTTRLANDNDQALMTNEPMNLEILCSTANQVEATAIINALTDRGIRTTATGAWTAGFQAEAPGDVKIMVARADLSRAAEALEEARREFAEFDWSAVDIPEDEPSPQAQHGPARPGDSNRRLQFSIAAILIVQALASAALAFWRTVLRGLGGRDRRVRHHLCRDNGSHAGPHRGRNGGYRTDLACAAFRPIARIIVMAELAAFAVIGVVALRR